MKNSFESDMIEMLILHVTALNAASGFDISQQVLERSQGHFDLREGALYPVLHRMERQNLLHTYWTEVAEDRRRKFYQIRAEGQMLLETRREQWRQFSTGVNGVTGTPEMGGVLDALACMRFGDASAAGA
jgi:PadR family transcriptional regulator PadR